MKKIVLAGVSSSSGKTTLACGLLRALKNRGIQVAPFKVGPDYIDPAFHEKAAGVSSRNLDEFMLPQEELTYLFSKASQGKEISVVEGVMGLFDGYGATKDFCSTAQMAKILKAPILLILDARSMAASAAAIVYGYSNLDPDLRISGVVLNRVSSSRHQELLTKAIEDYTGIPVLGAIPKDENFTLGSRHLGLIPSVEVEDLDKKLDHIASVVEKNINMDLLLKIAEAGNRPPDPYRREKIHKTTGIRMALAWDKAFHFYYRDALDLLAEMGVEIVPFSPLEDTSLPHCHGIYLGGGYPELFGPQLSANQDMIKEIRQKAMKGLPIYGECGGLMYLGDALEDLEGREFNMTALIPGKSKMTEKLQRFGYCQGQSPLHQIISTPDMLLKGHEFHYSNFQTQESPLYRMQKEQDGVILKEWSGGYGRKNILGSYLHIHFCGDYKTAQCFVKSMEQCHV